MGLTRKMSPCPIKDKLVLASTSPRRKAILESMGYEFNVLDPSVEEHFDGVFFEDIPILNARLKADAVAEKFPESLVLAADTVVEFAGRHFNKPDDEEQAVEMLMTLSGQEHQVVTGVCLQQRSKKILSIFAEISRVRFRKYGIDTAKAYMEVVNVMDKAGAYAVQEYGSLIVDEIIGSTTNVMGLPSEKLAEILLILENY